MNTEQFLTLKQAAALLPGKPHLSTLHRWRQRGVRGAKLRTTLVGGRRYTTEQWLREFSEACSSSSQEQQSESHPNNLRTKQIEAAERDLFGEAPDSG